MSLVAPDQLSLDPRSTSMAPPKSSPQIIGLQKSSPSKAYIIVIPVTTIVLYHHQTTMSRPLSLPIRLFSQTTRQNTPTQCLRQRTNYTTLNKTTTTTLRTFTSTPLRNGPVAPKMRQPAQPSMSRTQKEQQAAMMRAGLVPDDVGLLQDTFVLPRNPSERWSWRLRKKWLKTRFVDLYGFLAFKWILVKPRPVMEIFQLAPRAAAMHEEMYSAFAQGNLEAMKDKVCTGLFGSLRGRVLQRAPNTFLRWSVKKQLSSPKLCSYKAAVLPGPKGEDSGERNAQIQAVVKLHTLQSLQHAKKTSKREGRGSTARFVTIEESIGAEEQKESVEYVVIQRTLRKGKMGPWQVWGFTDEMTLAQIEKEDGNQ
jgi:protein MBA1